MPLTKLSNDQGYLKAGFLGYQKSGKSYTAIKLAIGVRAFFKHPGPIAFYDTEAGSGYLAEMVRKETSLDLLGVRARSFSALMSFANDCIAEKVSVAVVDSITHPWRELCDSYLAQLNERRAERRLGKMMKLEFQHWAEIKAKWEPWSEFYLNSPLHLIVCGRAGAIWEFEKNEESGRKELIKAGTKMKVEGEFGFEPSLLVEMERDQVPDGKGGFKLIHTATVLGDRFGILDGAVQENPTFEFFQPHVAMLRAGAHAPVDTTTKTATGADVEGGEWEKEKRQRTILCEEIQGTIVSKYPGQTAEEKKQKADLLQQVLGTRSWTKVENMQSDALRVGLEKLNQVLGINTQAEMALGDPEDDVPMGEATTPQPEPKDAAPGTPWARINELMTTKKNLDEAGLIRTLKALGSITTENSLAEVAKSKPSLLQAVADSWDTFVNASKEWK